MSQLCQLADLKAYIGVTDTKTDNVLTSLITGASAMIENYCNRIFASASYTETRNGNGSCKLFLINGPVTAVSAVAVDGLAVSPSPSTQSSGFAFDDSVVYLRGNAFSRGVQNVTVTYVAGFPAIPADVAQACIELVASKFAKRNRIDKTSETLGTAMTQGYSLADMPASVKTALSSYIRWSGK